MDDKKTLKDRFGRPISSVTGKPIVSREAMAERNENREVMMEERKRDYDFMSLERLKRYLSTAISASGEGVTASAGNYACYSRIREYVAEQKKWGVTKRALLHDIDDVWPEEVAETLRTMIAASEWQPHEERILPSL